jgi:hypothetical protein
MRIVMDTIVFCADSNLVTVDDAIRHLEIYPQLYWEVGYTIDKSQFSFPMIGLIHINGSQVEYRATIADIIPFSVSHYTAKDAWLNKPATWIKEWQKNIKNVRERSWKIAYVMTDIQPFSYDTLKLIKYKDKKQLTWPPRSYTRVLVSMPPTTTDAVSANGGANVKITLAGKNLEDFLVQQLESIEPGLTLVERQLSTAAGRLDLLCRDCKGHHVVIELKRSQGTDQVVGQILRYGRQKGQAV